LVLSTQFHVLQQGNTNVPGSTFADRRTSAVVGTQESTPQVSSQREAVDSHNQQQEAVDASKQPEVSPENIQPRLSMASAIKNPVEEVTASVEAAPDNLPPENTQPQDAEQQTEDLAASSP
jgi:hypothetical protein